MIEAIELSGDECNAIAASFIKGVLRGLDAEEMIDGYRPFFSKSDCNYLQNTIEALAEAAAEAITQ